MLPTALALLVAAIVAFAVAAARAAEAGASSQAAGAAADTPAQLQQLLSAAQTDETLMQELLQIYEQHRSEQVCLC